MLNAGLSTLVYLKSRLLPDAGQAETQWDAALMRVGLAVASLMQSHCNRKFSRTLGAEHLGSARALAVSVAHFPVEQVTAVELAEIGGTLTTLGADYTLDKAAGVLEFLRPPGSFAQRLVITYDGGFWLNDGAAMPAGATPLPDDLLEAWVIQCQAMAASRALFGSVALTDPKAPKPSGAMLPEVVAMLRVYRRFAGE